MVLSIVLKIYAALLAGSIHNAVQEMVMSSRGVSREYISFCVELVYIYKCKNGLVNSVENICCSVGW